MKVHGKKAEEKEVIVDTTVQEKNITYPTDTKLHRRIIEFCWRVAEKEDIDLRQSYRRTIPKLTWDVRYIRHKTRNKQGRKAIRKIKTIAGRLVRDLERKMSEEAKEKYREGFEIANKILSQERYDKNKIYSFHEPHVACIAKGKEHKKYEFGSKVSILLTKNSGIIVGAMNFTGNPYDGKTLQPQVEQYNENFAEELIAIMADDGFRISKYIGKTKILRVHGKRDKDYSKWQWKQRFRRRATVEAVIGHLKSDFRMARNYLKGEIGDIMNLLLACSAFNFKKLMRELAFCLQNIIAVLNYFLLKNPDLEKV